MTTVVEGRSSRAGRGVRRRWYVVGKCGHRTMIETRGVYAESAILGVAYKCPLCPGGWAGPPVKETT